MGVLMREINLPNPFEHNWGDFRFHRDGNLADPPIFPADESNHLASVDNLKNDLEDVILVMDQG